MNRTRIVRWLRVLLPLLALVMLSTLFLFSRKPSTEPEIPYAEVDAESMARDPRIVAPEFAGVTSDGATISLRASEAAPAGGGTAQDVRLDWRRPDGLTADVTASDAGVVDNVVQLRGGVRMTTSSGWTVDTDQIDASTDRSHIAAETGIEAQAPFGRITAGRMELTPEQGAADDAPAILNFSDGVRLLYQP